MAGLIRPADLATVKERTSIEDVVREHVTLRTAGAGSLKGLCPFHDEKSPSFTVRPAVGAYHCFGCGEGGDVISFLQKVEHLTFVEAIEKLAQRLGMQLTYEPGSGRSRDEAPGQRGRLLEAHRAAQEVYAEWLLGLPEARTARDFMRERDFDGAVATRFGVGYAPRGGEEVTRHLRDKGFSEDELVASGISGRGRYGLYDKFRGRLVWPIRDITGATVGFGARRLFDDDRLEAKYLNTAETPIYKKSSVLYGLDFAKKSIAKERQVVIVEGYTDVMACHLAGVESAVATCGTAFGGEHITVLRRLIRDETSTAPAKVIFTFDGDAAGQKAAMRAFDADQRWASQSFVAVEASGMDPCELRQSRGDQAVVALVDDAIPMFEFAVRTTIARFDLMTAEGRVLAMRAAAPIIATIRDASMRPEYTRTVAGWLGVEISQLSTEVSRAAKQAAKAPAKGSAPSDGGATPSHTEGAEPTAAEVGTVIPRPDLRDPTVMTERQLLQCALQYPRLVSAEDFGGLTIADFTAPAHQAVYDAIVAAGGPGAAATAAAWGEAVMGAAPVALHGLISELFVDGLPVRYDVVTGQPEQRFVDSLLARLRELAITRSVADVMSELRRLDNDPDADAAHKREVSATLARLHRERAALREMGVS